MDELTACKIQAAISYFEDAVRESDEIINDCTEALQAELTEQKKHFVVALEVMRRTESQNKHGILLSCDGCKYTQHGLPHYPCTCSSGCSDGCIRIGGGEADFYEAHKPEQEGNHDK